MARRRLKEYQPPLPQVICPRFGDPRAKLCTGATVGACDKCAAAVWMSPESRERQLKDQMPVLCIECAVEQSRAHLDAGGAVVEVRSEQQVNKLPGRN